MRTKAWFVLLALALALALGGYLSRQPKTAGRPADPTPTAPVLIDVSAASPAATPVSPEKPSAGPVEVTWYVRASDPQQQWQKETVAQFEAAHPQIHVKLVVQSWENFDIQMRALIAAGAPPDIWTHGGPSGFRDYLARGLVADLTPYIQKDNFDLADFIPGVLDIYRVDGKLYGLPMQSTGSYVYYNKDLFDAAGVPYPPANWDDASWTWDAFLDRCKRLTSTRDPQSPTFGCLISPDAFWPDDAMAWLWGQDLYPDDAYKTGFAKQAFLDQPAALTAFQAWRDLAWKFHYMPNAEQQQASGGGDLFAAGKVAMSLGTGAAWTGYGMDKLGDSFNWGVAALPYGNTGRRAVLFTDPWMMSSHSAHPAEAWEFLKYLLSPEVQRAWMRATGAPPPRQSLLDEWAGQYPGMQPNEAKQAYLGALKYGRETPGHLLVRFDQLDGIVRAAVGPVLANQKKASEALPEANRQLVEMLKQIAAQYGR